MTAFDYIIYHRNCPDGFAAVAVAFLAKAINKDTILLPDDPYVTAAPTIVQNKTVLIVDVAYKANVIDEICKAARSVLMIDHHKTTQEELENRPMPPHFKFVYEDGVCGALITWRYFMRGERPPKALVYINDNDVGIWKHKKTIPFMLALDVSMSTKPKLSNVIEWAKLLKHDDLVKPMVEDGQLYQTYQKTVSTRAAYSATLASFPSKELYDKFPDAFDHPEQYTVAVLNGGCPSVTASAAAVMEIMPCDIVMVWVYSIVDDTYRISMRSKEVDVAAIAHALNPHGGGHKLAASFSISGDVIPIRRMFSPKPRRNAGYQR